MIDDNFSLGEEKPQPFIVLDIDRQVEGKLVTNNQMPIGSPNGRLPMSSNYQPNATLPMPLYLSQTQPNHHPTSSTPFLLDGGVYQGQAPTTSQPQTQVNQWNPNSKVKRSFSSSISFLFLCSDDGTSITTADVHVRNESAKSRILSE